MFRTTNLLFAALLTTFAAGCAENASEAGAPAGAAETAEVTSSPRDLFDFGKSDPDNHDAHVMSVKKAGGRPSVVASRIGSPYALVLAGACPVWAASNAIQTTGACGN